MEQLIKLMNVVILKALLAFVFISGVPGMSEFNLGHHTITLSKVMCIFNLHDPQDKLKKLCAHKLYMYNQKV